MKKFSKRLIALLCAVWMCITLLPVEAAAVEEGTLYHAWYDGATGEVCSEPLPADTTLQCFPMAGAQDIALFDDDQAGEGTGGLEDAPHADYFLRIDEDLPRYGYSQLEKMGDAFLLNVYSLLAYLALYGSKDASLFSGLDETNTKPTINVNVNNEVVSVPYISEAEAILVTQAFYADFPELFWARPEYLHTDSKINGSYPCVGVQLAYNNHAKNLEESKKAFLAAADAILKGLPSGGSNFDKELYLHDALITKVTYDINTVSEQNAYGALIDGRAVCAGYAFAFQYLLMRARIESFYVTGTSHKENHAWNIAKIDGDWYYVDPTWDDPLFIDQGAATTYESPYSPHYAYFNLTTDAITRDHTIDATHNVTLPECTATKGFYHNVKGTVIRGDEQERLYQVSTALWNGNGTARLYGDISWIDSNSISAICSAIGLSGTISYHTFSVGQEHVLILTASSGSYPPPPTPGHLNSDNVVNIQDVQTLFHFLITGTASAEEFTPTMLKFFIAADLNHDYRIDVYDLQMLYEIVRGLRT